MTRAILFDVDGVLVHSRFHPDAKRRRLWDEHLLSDLGVDPARLQAFFRTEFMPVITGQHSLVDALDTFLPTVGYTGSTLRFIEYWLERDTHVNYALIEEVTRLHRSADVRVFVATNQEHLRAAYLWRELRLGHVFDDMLYAARLGAAKPDPLFYERAARHLTACDGPPLLFDDSREVVEAARAFGWDAALFNDLEDFTTHPWIAANLRESGSARNRDTIVPAG
ncbi:HAD family hydrolase [Devosia geojensis]|uniref:HAD family hydrolase n=1 Tax=Devosia geojensis TaxID=443610 RepID=UPI000696E7CF|nr:HAD-IA family hydrolase [Devosia geojensis]